MNDKRNSLTKHRTKRYNRRNKSQITKIAIHHSATLTGSAEAFANFHVNTNDWAGIAYHYVVNKDGSVDWCNDLETVSFHVGNSNSIAVGICMVGDFTREKPTDAQYKACLELTRKLLEELNLKPSDVWGHQQFPGYATKQCPSIDMNIFRSELSVEGWVNINGTWFYYQDNKRKSGWVKDKGKWYFLDGGGAMKTGWIKDKNKWYFLKSNGEMATGLLVDKGKVYYLDPVNGDMATGTVTLKANSDGSLY